MKTKSVIIVGLLILSTFLVSAEVDMNTAKSHAVAKGDGKGTGLGVSASTYTSTNAEVDGEGEAIALAGSMIGIEDSSSSVNTNGVANSMTKTIENPAVTVEISHSMANSNTVAHAGDDGYAVGGNLVFAGTESGDTGTYAVGNTFAKADSANGDKVSVDHDHMVSHETTITHNEN